MRKRIRTESLITELAGVFLNERTTGKSLLTVVDTRLSDDGKNAQVFVSVFPAEHQKEAHSFLMRQGGEFRTYLAVRARLRTIPRIEFIPGESMAPLE